MKIKTWIIRLLALYLVVLAAWLAFSLASLRFERVAALRAHLVEPYLGLVANGQVYLGEVAVNGERIGVPGQLTDAVPEDWGQVETWVFLLEGFPSIQTSKPAKDLGLNVTALAMTKPGHSVVLYRGGLKFRFALLPFVAVPKKIVLLDYAHIRATYRQDCWAAFINNSITSQPDQANLETCKRAG